MARASGVLRTADEIEADYRRNVTSAALLGRLLDVLKCAISTGRFAAIPTVRPTVGIRTDGGERVLSIREPASGPYRGRISWWFGPEKYLNGTVERDAFAAAISNAGFDADWSGQANSDCYDLGRLSDLSDEQFASLLDLIAGLGKYSDARAVDLAEPPPRLPSIVQRIVRDTAMVRRLKLLYGDACMICDTALAFPDGSTYSEGHHLRPLGAPHNGPDVPGNIVIVCPNHHAALDKTKLTIDPVTVVARPGHTIDSSFVDYHNVLVQRHLTCS